MRHLPALIAALSLAVITAIPAEAAPQIHRHTQRTAADSGMTAVSTAAKKASATVSGSTAGKGKGSATADKKRRTNDSEDEITAYSDTSSQGGYCAEEDYGSHYDRYRSTDDSIVSTSMQSFMSLGEGHDFMKLGQGMIETLLILVILFILSPLGILGLIFYFIYKNRKQKYKLAEMAIKAGQPVPEALREKTAAKPSGTLDKGLKNIFLGMGLVAFFWIIDITVGIAVGVLIIFNGAGQTAIAYAAERRKRRGDFSDNREEGFDDTGKAI